MDQLKKYHDTVLDYLGLCNSPVFRLLKNKRIKPHQVAIDNLLKVFALELKLKSFEPGFPKDAASSFLTNQFPGLLDNLKNGGRYWVSWYTSNSPEQGVTVWPEELKIWNTGGSSKYDTLCAVVETGPDFTLIDFWTNLVTYFPDADVRFCTIIGDDGDDDLLGDRFPGYDSARTTIRNPKSGVQQ